MSKKVVLIVVVILLAIGGGIAYLAAKPADNQPEQASPLSDQPAGQDEPDQAVSSSAVGTYVNYKPGAIENTSGTKLLFFHAPWCPQCRQLDDDIQKNGVPQGVTIFKVDYDSNQALRQKYGVTIQTTLVRVDDQGNLVEKFVAYEDPSLAAVVRELL